MAARLGLAVVAVAAITLFCFKVVAVNATTAALAYLLLILLLATRWGLTEAIVASVVSMLCFNFFFLPPLLTFTIADPQNWVALVAFLTTSIIGGHLSNRAKLRAVEAVARQREMERLYALSRAILLAGGQREAARQIAFQIAQIFEFPAVAIYEREKNELYAGGPETLPVGPERLREAALQGTQFHDKAAGVTVTAIRLGGEPIGALGVRGVAISDTALQSVSYLVAIGMERARSEEAAAQAEAARESERLKSTLLDAIAHEFQTPLTSVKAAATALVSVPAPGEEARRELATIVDEEADRLSRLVSDAIQMARVEAGGIRLSRASYSVSELVTTALHSRQSALEGRPVTVELSPVLPEVSVDLALLELALRQVLDNALKFSPPGSPLGIGARVAGGNVVLTVTDRGPGIPAREQQRIFEKYYRGSGTRLSVGGSGMGLAIARDILRAHGGDIQVASTDGEGSEFALTVPAAAEDTR